ncbi:ABC transporter permease [Blastococcus mobilis]|uniref:ABC-2 type transport system permease protein n=1 Tax=Blastococcus mobilis TaxID=1938746 RepID=A0A238YTU8_9ACTN|nr:polyketide antibiotic transporter [Blastococcus mobilis]SNR74706.1 ABC-2 type transport system permease protein [Blastococcus mobilis]
MTSRTATRPQAPAATASAPARGVVLLAVRLVRRGTLVVTVLSGVLAAFVAVQYRSTFQGALTTGSLTALADNPAIRTLFGPARALDDAGGFTVWRTGTVLAVLAGVWAALTATRVTRGEEESGRWDLLLAGRVRAATLVRRQLAVVLVAAALPGVAVAIGMLLVGTVTTGALLFGAVVAGAGLTGAACGGLAAQLLAERRAASGLAVGLVLAGLLLRMVGDGVDALGWLRWLSPFGLLSTVAPYADDRAAPLLVLAALAVVPAVIAVVLAGRRDVGAGLLGGRDTARSPSPLLRSLPGLCVHRVRRALVTWGVGVGAYFLLIGLLATAMTDFLEANRQFAELAVEAGFDELFTVQGYAASLFSLLAVPVGAFAASRIAASAADEVAGRLALLYSLPVRRARWAGTEAATVALGCVVLASVAGLATWAGAAWVGSGLTSGEALAGALNVVPVALLCLGAALFALGYAPGAVLAIGVLPAAGGYLLLLFADTFGWPEAARALSPFAHVASVPADPPDLVGAVGMVAVAAVLGFAGVVAYARRDLRE